VIRRLDHVAVLVRDTDDALLWFRDRLGMTVVMVDVINTPPVKLTYLDCGNAFFQLVEPLDTSGQLAALLESRGEGFHHVCFGVDDPVEEAKVMASDGSTDILLGSGRGRRSVFAPGPVRFGIRLECTQFDHHIDVESTPGYLK